jgi:hypothetical protein
MTGTAGIVVRQGPTFRPCRRPTEMSTPMIERGPGCE